MPRGTGDPRSLDFSPFFEVQGAIGTYIILAYKARQKNYNLIPEPKISDPKTEIPKTQILFNIFGCQLVKLELIIGNSGITIWYPKYLNSPRLVSLLIVNFCINNYV